LAFARETNFRTATNTTRVVEIRFPLCPVLAHHALSLSLSLSLFCIFVRFCLSFSSSSSAVGSSFFCAALFCF
jgi:hypothetical protein